MSDLYVYLFTSRNKDNTELKSKDTPAFKQRLKAFIGYKQNEEAVLKEFKDFAAKGVQGETVRLYRSVNSRNEDKIREGLIIHLLKDKPSMTKLNRLLASVAQQSENKDESKWLFDFDVDDDTLHNEFMNDIPVDTVSYKTPHGYAIIAEHGFDTRELMEKWKDYDITLKKDDLLYLDSITNN